MARVRPFAAWRYARAGGDLTSVTAPPYDVVTDDQRAALLHSDPYNAVTLELPDGPLDPTLPGNRYETGRALWDIWRAEGVLLSDPEPMVYVLEQQFVAEGKDVRRRAIIAEVGLEPFDAGVVIPHERTLPKALGDRFELIKATGANLSQVLSLYEDESMRSESIFETITSGEPIAHATDSDGVRSVLWANGDADVAAQLAEFMADRRVFIADGHHRYTTALAYRDLRRAEAQNQGTSPSDPAYDYVMMALVNMDDPGLVVMPYHRIAESDGPFDDEAFYRELALAFDVSEVPPSDIDTALEGHDRVVFLVKTRADSRARLAVLRHDVNLDAAIPLDHTAAWKSLDVAVVQELVLAPLMGIHPDRPETLQRMSFTHDARRALDSSGEHDLVLVMRATRMDQLRAVSLNGETMPQKSTYFYPKLPTGLVFRSAE